MGYIPREMHVYETAAYERHAYERQAYEMADGRYTPMGEVRI